MSLTILEKVPLAPLTTLKIGGPARFFVEATAEEHILEGFEFAATNQLRVFILGGGSNVLISDAGFDGLVIHTVLKGKLREGNRFTVGAGEEWDPFVSDSIAEGFAGLECMSGIPGYVGGTPVQNVGAYGQEVSETIVLVRCFDREDHSYVDILNEQCGFEYRKSIFNSSHIDRYVVVSVTFQLHWNGEPKIVYKDLKEHFGETRPSLINVRDAVINIRKAKSMVIDAGDPNSKSAGSFFKNPIVSVKTLENLAAEFDSVPSFMASGGLVKLPAAWLIEKAGFSKGHIKGKAGISTNHSLALINRGGATAAEIIALKNEIHDKVKEKFGIDLHPEPIFVGF